MTTSTKPDRRPANPSFSTGPCSKIPGWSPDLLAAAVLGRSHRSIDARARLRKAIDLTREVLEVPDSHLIGFVPASDTGAVEMSLWNLLGARGVDVLVWESFGAGWASDVGQHLGLEDLRILEAPYGELPDLAQVDFSRDVVFTWNGTTSGVRVPDAEWISESREGLTICDATSAAFAQALDFTKLDVVTYSWQKVLGGEGAHGVLILSPRAIARLESYRPPWPLPKIFRLTKGGKLNAEIFDGATINTPSLLCVEDYIVALNWARELGGWRALKARADRNAAIIANWVQKTPWVEHLAIEPATRSNTSVCLKLADPVIANLSDARKAMLPGQLAKLLETEGAAFDIGGYRDAPPGLRVWCGATVSASDLEALLPWLDWAFTEVSVP